MKNKGLLLINLILSSILSILYSNQVVGQDKVNISIGFGLPELLNMGVRYQFEQAQLGASFGFIPLKDESIYSISGDIYYHFAGSSELSKRRPWYGRIGLDYLRDETESLIDKYMYLNLRIGRDFNISKRIGIEFDVGASFQLSNETVRKTTSSGFYLDLTYPVVPSGGIGFFYRF